MPSSLVGSAQNIKYFWCLYILTVRIEAITIETVRDKKKGK